MEPSPFLLYVRPHLLFCFQVPPQRYFGSSVTPLFIGPLAMPNFDMGRENLEFSFAVFVVAVFVASAGCCYYLSSYASLWGNDVGHYWSVDSISSFMRVLLNVMTLLLIYCLVQYCSLSDLDPSHTFLLVLSSFTPW